MRHQVPFSEYGVGGKPLLAFHGYGMDGNQFKVLENSFCLTHKIYGFHMPYHKHGPQDGEAWIDHLLEQIRGLFPTPSDHFSLLGYSLGSKVALKILEVFPSQVDEIYLLAPYGLEAHAGLDFVSKGWGNSLFKAIVKTKWPERIMKVAHKLKVINSELKTIILEEMNSTTKRLNLCRSLNMIGQIELDKESQLRLLGNEIPCTLIYGTNDFLFPYHKRDLSWDSMMTNLEVLAIEEGHWMVTETLDLFIAKLRKAA